MAAREDQLKPLVRKPVSSPQARPSWPLPSPGSRAARLLGERGIASDAVDCAVASGDRQPCARVGRQTLARPALRRDRECLLRRVLGEIESPNWPTSVARTRPHYREDLVEQRGYRSTIGRTSTAPPMRAAEHARRGPSPRRGCPPEQGEAPDVLLGVDERAVAQEPLAVLHAYGRRRLWKLKLHPPSRHGFSGSASYSPTIDLSWFLGMSWSCANCRSQARDLHGSLLARVGLPYDERAAPEGTAAAASCARVDRAESRRAGAGKVRPFRPRDGEGRCTR